MSPSRPLTAPLRARSRSWSYLDVGCGNGQATLHVADALGLRAVGVDVDAAQIELARRAACNRTDVSFVTASATRLPSIPHGSTSSPRTRRATRPGLVAGPRRNQKSGRTRRVHDIADLNVPSALAPLLRLTAGHVAGVFTRHDLDRGFAGLRGVHRNAGWLHYEAVFEAIIVADTGGGRRTRLLMRLAGLVAIIAVVAIVGHASGAVVVTADKLREWVQGFSRLGPLVFIGLFLVLDSSVCRRRCLEPLAEPRSACSRARR